MHGTNGPISFSSARLFSVPAFITRRGFRKSTLLPRYQQATTLTAATVYYNCSITG